VPSEPSKELITVPNPEPGRDYEIVCETDELTCLCPVTGQPDFATVRITYVPDELLVELKSLKMYLWSFRDEGAFHEAVTNRILDDLVAAGCTLLVVAVWRLPRPSVRVTLALFRPLESGVRTLPVTVPKVGVELSWTKLTGSGRPLRLRNGRTTIDRRGTPASPRQR